MYFTFRGVIMGILDRLLKRKEKKGEVKEMVEEKIKLTDIERLCLDSPQVFDALKDTMFLDPRKIDVSLKDAVFKAKEFEKAGDVLRAALWYRIAGGLAIYKGDAFKAKEFFGKYAKLTGKSLKILEIPEKAVKKAQEYYRKCLEKKR